MSWRQRPRFSYVVRETRIDVQVLELSKTTHRSKSSGRRSCCSVSVRGLWLYLRCSEKKLSWLLSDALGMIRVYRAKSILAGAANARLGRDQDFDIRIGPETVAGSLQVSTQF